MIPMSTLHHLLASYGYLTVLLVVALESTGIPAPGETILLLAAVAASTTHLLSLPLVIGAAACGAVLGDNLGYWIGSTLFARLLHRLGHRLHSQERKIKLGLYLFHRHGGKVVFFGRFVTILRMWAAVLAGLSGMRWITFLGWNALGGCCWAIGYGIFGYVLGSAVYRFTGPVGIVLLVLTAGAMVALFLLLRKHEHQWEQEALLCFPEPLEAYLGETKYSQQRQTRHRTSLPTALSNQQETDLTHLVAGRYDSEDTQRLPILVTVTTHNLPPIEGRASGSARPHLSTQRAGHRLHPLHLEPLETTRHCQKEQRPQ
jgi:membrane protein DedA with SNARE-associated domain